jgi:hypothetical protein
MQHWGFTNILLRKVFFQDPGKFMSALKGDSEGKVLRALWDSAGLNLPAENRVQSRGLTAETVIVGKEALEIAIINLPPPMAATEAYFVALVPPGSQRSAEPSMIMLELGVGSTGIQTTFLTRWQGETHGIVSEGLSADRQAFCQAVSRVLSGVGGPVERPSPASNRVDFRDRFPELQPIPSPPTLYRINGVGTTVLGERDRDHDTSTYVKTRYFTFLYIPIAAIDAFRVADAPKGWYFIGREPLTLAEKVFNAIVPLAAVSLVLGFLIAVAP